MKNIIKKINVFGIVALFVAAGFAMGSKAEKVDVPPNTLLWGRTEAGSWVETTDNAKCYNGLEICKMHFPETQDPNTNPSGGIPHEGGDLGYVQ